MSDSFAGQTIPCPYCKATNARRVPLECSERNYSGCSVDIANCPKCGRAYQVSYRVAEVARVNSFDMQSRVELEAETKQRRAANVETKRQELAELLTDLGTDEREGEE